MEKELFAKIVLRYLKANGKTVDNLKEEIPERNQPVVVAECGKEKFRFVGISKVQEIVPDEWSEDDEELLVYDIQKNNEWQKFVLGMYTAYEQTKLINRYIEANNKQLQSAILDLTNLAKGEMIDDDDFNLTEQQQYAKYIGFIEELRAQIIDLESIKFNKQKAKCKTKESFKKAIYRVYLNRSLRGRENESQRKNFLMQAVDTKIGVDGNLEYKFTEEQKWAYLTIKETGDMFETFYNGQINELNAEEENLMN